MLMRVTVAAGSLWLGLAGGATAAEDTAAQAFNNHCRNCHSIMKGDHRLGPSLYAVYGAKAGKAKGYRGYSLSLDDVTWDEDTLDRFMADPASVVTSTNMIYPPVADPQERRRIIEYLKSHSQ